METDVKDRWKRHLFLTEEGKLANPVLEQRSEEQVDAMYSCFSSAELKQITDAMDLYLRKKTEKNVPNH